MITVNGRETDAAGSVLDACRAVGADVPAFCHGEGLSRGGHCRACMVEVDGRPVAACATAAREGMRVETDTERLRAYRLDLGELMLAESSPGGAVAATLSAWGATGGRYGRPASRGLQDRSHPHLRIDLDHCILCRLCVRACAEVQGEFVYAVHGRGAGARLHWAGGPFADSRCVSCGACVDVCPTGAIFDADRETAPAAERTVRTTCAHCAVGCQLDAHVAADRVVRVDGAPAAANRGHLCLKGRYAHAHARHPDRLATPLVRRDGALVPASWDEATALVARELARLRGRVAGVCSPRQTNEEFYLFQKWLRGGLGTNDVDGSAGARPDSWEAALREALGDAAASGGLDDIERADLILVAGSDATETHPVAGARLRQAVLRGARLVVLDPRRTALAAIADVHLQAPAGAGIALLEALAVAMVQGGCVRRAFVAERVEDWPAYEASSRARSLESLSNAAGVPLAVVREAAWLLGTAERPLIVLGDDGAERGREAEVARRLCDLALLAGAFGRPGAGLLPLRGGTNGQGAADMGCSPDLLPGGRSAGDPEARERCERVWGRPLPAAPGRTLARLLHEPRGEVRAMFVLGEDLLGAVPGGDGPRRMLEGLELLVVQDAFLTETARIAHVVLPGTSTLERDGTFTSLERRIQRVRAALRPVAGARPDWQILCALMEATGWPQRFDHPSAIMDEIARVVPDYAGVSYARLDGEGLQWPAPASDHPGTPVRHLGSFPRGRGALSVAGPARPGRTGS